MSFKDWGAKKASFPLGQLPVLVEKTGDDSVVLPQSNAILRHLARTYSFYGKVKLRLSVSCHVSTVLLCTVLDRVLSACMLFRQTERQHSLTDVVHDTILDFRLNEFNPVCYYPKFCSDKDAIVKVLDGSAQTFLNVSLFPFTPLIFSSTSTLS